MIFFCYSFPVSRLKKEDRSSFNMVVRSLWGTISVHHQILPIFTTTCSGPAISQCDGSYDVFFSYYVSDGSDLDHRILLSTAPLALQSAAVYSCGGLNTGITRARFYQRPALSM